MMWRTSLAERLSAFSAALFVVAVISAPAFPADAEGRAVYRLGSGDRLQVTVFGHEDLSGDFEVDGGGRAALPLVGGVRLGGLTIDEAERAVLDALKPDYLKNPRVSIQVLNYRPFYILGEVKKPGSYAYVNGLTMIGAVALAGGFTYRADKKDVYLVRSADPERRKRRAQEDTPVLPGDVVRVPERFF